MVKPKSTYQEGMHTQDEGWWASVLADEKRYSAPSVSYQPLKDDASRSNSDWTRAQAVYQQDQIVNLHVTSFNRGGLLVEGDGLQGFVPISHLLEIDNQLEPAHREEELSRYVGNKLRLKIIECVPEEGRVVFSERAAKADAGRRVELFETLEKGQRVTGEVTNVTDFGVFVDLGGVEGLIHISELSWGRVAHPGQILGLGQKVSVEVLDVCEERCRVALSLKRLYPNPWETAEDRYPVNSVIPAEVTGVVAFGAFARLEEGLEGLIHVSEMSLPVGMAVKDHLSSGQKVMVKVLHVDAPHQRLGLSLVTD